MNPWQLVGLVVAGGFLLAISIWSFQSLWQARLLRACRVVSLAGLAGRAAALRGPVKVRQALRIAHLGDCLWHREVVKYSGGLAGTKSPWMKDADTAEMADFSIVVGGEEVRVTETPTEVQGKAVKAVEEKAGLVAGIVGAMDERVTDEWLPILRELTVVGRVRHGDRGWEIGHDGKAGLLFSVHDPSAAAFRESLKGWFGLAAALIGFALLVVLHAQMA